MTSVVSEDRKSTLCRYYMNGACVRGEACQFSHDMNHVPNTVCTHWLKGHCAFGDKCRYDHVRPEWNTSKKRQHGVNGYVAPDAVPKPPTERLEEVLPISQLRLSGRLVPDTSNHNDNSDSLGLFEAKERDIPPPVELPLDPFGEGLLCDANGLPPVGHDDDIGFSNAAEVLQYSQEGNKVVPRTLSDTKNESIGNGDDACPTSSGNLSRYAHVKGESGKGTTDGHQAKEESVMEAWHVPHTMNHKDGSRWSEGNENVGEWSSSLCYEYYRSGTCSNGEVCRMAHGNFCQICENYALHPSDKEQAHQHTVECKARHDRLNARARSAHVECGICYERVLEKQGGDRKFGLLSCEHAFCLNCIRNWRNNVQGGADVESALRTCPICRIATHYITPSTVWPQTEEEKEEILNGYKAKLASIDCKYFNFGEGTCPFGTSCMYKHAYLDGRLEDSMPRRVAVDEGEVKFVQPVRLSDFLVINQGKVQGRRR